MHPNQHFRCVSNGDYDQIQCIGDNCYCVNATDGSPGTDDAKMSPVNITVVDKETIDCCRYLRNFGKDQEIKIKSKYFFNRKYDR